MIDLQRLRALRASPRALRRGEVATTDRDPRFLSFINLPVLALCLGSWAVLVLGFVTVVHMD